MKQIYFLLAFSFLRPLSAGLPPDSLKRIQGVFGKESACFVLKEKAAAKNQITFGKKLCESSFELGNRALLPLAITATERGLIQDEKTLFKWDGTRYPNKLWNKDQFVTDWLQNQVSWVTDRLRLQIGADPIEKHLKEFQLDGLVSTNRLLSFSEKFFLRTLPIKKETQEVARRFFYIGKYREGSEVWGQKASGEDYASFVGHLVLKNQAWTFTTLLKSSKESSEPVTAERAQALSMDALTELGLF